MSKRKVKQPVGELALRKWAIEQANLWKWDSGGRYQSYTGGHIHLVSHEPDLLDRAQKILNWVNWVKKP